MTQDEIKRFIKMHRAGKTYAEMSEELHYCVGYLRKRATALGLPKRSRGRRRWENTVSAKDVKDLKLQWESGVSRVKICEWWGFSLVTLASICKRLGLKPRRNR